MKMRDSNIVYSQRIHKAWALRLTAAPALACLIRNLLLFAQPMEGPLKTHLNQNMPDLDSYLAQTVYPALFSCLDSAFAEFGWEKQGDHWVAQRWPPDFPCQVEHRRPDRLVFYPDRPYWIKIHGHGGVRFLDLVNGGRPPRGADFVKAVQRLCELAGVPFPDRRFTPEQEDRARRREAHRSVLDTVMAYAQKTLWSPCGQAARDYLIGKRGFTEEDIRTLGFGLYLSTEDARKAIEQVGYDAQEIRDAAVLWDKLQGFIFIPWHDDFGRPLTIYGRWAATSPPLKKDLLQWQGDRDKERAAWEKNPDGKEWEEPVVPKTIALPGEGTKRSPLFLDRALQAGHRDVVLVEGVFDAALLQARGDTRSVASAAAQLNHQQVETLVRRGIRSAYICGDPDGGGDKGTSANITVLEKAGINSFVVPRLPEGLDPDDYVRENGIEKWKTRVGGSIHSYRLLAQKIIEQYRPDGTWTDAGMASVLDAAIKFDASITAPEKLTDLDGFFWPAIYETTGVDTDALLARRQAIREKQAHERELRAYQSLNSSVGKLLQTGNLQDAKGMLVETLGHLQEEHRSIKIEPVMSLADELMAHSHRLEKYRGAEFIGLPQKTLPRLDELTLGLRKLMLLAAAPNVGKTALAVQLGMDIVVHNPDACFLFLSLEMLRWDIYTRIKCRLARMDWKTLVFGSGNARGRGRDATYTQQELANLQKAETMMAEWGNRVRVLDERNFPAPTLSNVLFQLEDMKSRTGSMRAFLLIDYLQVWPIPETEAKAIRSDLDGDKYRIGMMKSLRDAAEDDAIVVISEARKPAGNSGDKWGGALADVMGSARGSYTPDMVFLLRPFDDGELLDWSGQTASNAHEREEIAEGLRADLVRNGKALNKFQIAKGRDGVLRGTIDLTFLYRQSIFEEGVDPWD